MNRGWFLKGKATTGEARPTMTQLRVTLRPLKESIPLIDTEHHFVDLSLHFLGFVSKVIAVRRTGATLNSSSDIVDPLQVHA
jgi:hypothetical protein